MIPWQIRMWLPTRGELRVLRADVAAVLSGYCNRGDSWRWGGYAHWRCGLRRGHDLPHRFRNYTWAGPGAQVEYDPVPMGQAMPGSRDMIVNGSYFYRIRRMLELDQRMKHRDLRRRRALR